MNGKYFFPILDGYPMKFRGADRFFYCNGGIVVLALPSSNYGVRVFDSVWVESVPRRGHER